MSNDWHDGSTLFATSKAPPSGLRKFPTVACSASATPCGMCADCANDCVDCEFCERGECSSCVAPDLTPRTANTLVISGRNLAAEVTEVMLGSRRPVFLHHLLRAFEELSGELVGGRKPRPHTLAEQLCLYLMISYATDLACGIGEEFNSGLPLSDYDYYFNRLYDTLLRDDEHMPLIEAAKPLSRPGRFFDFDALASVVSDATIAKMLIPYEE